MSAKEKVFLCYAVKNPQTCVVHPDSSSRMTVYSLAYKGYLNYTDDGQGYLYCSLTADGQAWVERYNRFDAGFVYCYPQQQVVHEVV